MNIKELVADLKAKGLTDEEIKKSLEEIKAEIDAFLTPAKEEDVTKDDVEKEKMNNMFGLDY